MSPCNGSSFGQFSWSNPLLFQILQKLHSLRCLPKIAVRNSLLTISSNLPHPQHFEQIWTKFVDFVSISHANELVCLKSAAQLPSSKTVIRFHHFDYFLRSAWSFPTATFEPFQPELGPKCFRSSNWGETVLDHRLISARLTRPSTVPVSPQVSLSSVQPQHCSKKMFIDVVEYCFELLASLWSCELLWCLLRQASQAYCSLCFVRPRSGYSSSASLVFSHAVRRLLWLPV